MTYLHKPNMFHSQVPLPPDDDKTFDMDQNSQNTVLSGTTVLQVRGKTDVLAVVVRTGEWLFITK